jgi:hypothetical protein
MTDERLRIIFGGITQLMVTGLVGAAWLLDKVSSTEALIPLLALGGLEIAGRATKGRTPPGGPTAAALFMALQALQTTFV